MKNYYWAAFIITAVVVAVLFLLGQLPDFQMFGRKMRRVDLLSDVRPDKPDTVAAVDTVVLEALVERDVVIDYADTCWEGTTCITDYADTTMSGMDHFYAMLDSIDHIGRPVRVAVFGDSFIEGDIFTADLREMLQDRYGGCGVGWVNITSNVANFRPTVVHRFGGWRTRSAVDSIYDRKLLGLNSSYSLPAAAESYVELECTSRYASHVGRAEVSRLYFRADSDTVRLAYSLNGGEPNAIEMRGQGMKVATVSGDIHSVKWTVGGTRAPFWGVALEGRRGIVVDNLSLRGSSGFNFLSIPQETLRQFAARREYDLIILQYGLNVATADRRDYKGYKDNMVQVVGRLQECFPGTSIVLFSVGDRMSKDEDGDLVTMPGIVNLASYQQAVAVDTGVAWWSLLDAFKSLGGIAAFAEAKPAMANLDYTHINFRGGRRLAEEFFEALMCGKENYDNARAAAQGREIKAPPTAEQRQSEQY